MSLVERHMKRHFVVHMCHGCVATLHLFLNLDLKRFYSLRLSLNTDLTCRQRLCTNRTLLALFF